MLHPGVDVLLIGQAGLCRASLLVGPTGKQSGASLRDCVSCLFFFLPPYSPYTILHRARKVISHSPGDHPPNCFTIWHQDADKAMCLFADWPLTKAQMLVLVGYLLGSYAVIAYIFPSLSEGRRCFFKHSVS